MVFICRLLKHGDKIPLTSAQQKGIRNEQQMQTASQRRGGTGALQHQTMCQRACKGENMKSSWSGPPGNAIPSQWRKKRKPRGVLRSKVRQQRVKDLHTSVLSMLTNPLRQVRPCSIEENHFPFSNCRKSPLPFKEGS